MNFEIHNNYNLISKLTLNQLVVCADDSYCIGYARQSTKNQKSLDEQIDEIKKRAFNDNYKNVIIFKCKGSGWNPNSIAKLKDFQKMLKLIPKLKSNMREIKVYIYDVSRFMRNVLVASVFINDIFEPNDCSIVSIIDNRIFDKNNNNRLDFLRELVEAEAQSLKLSNKMKVNVLNRKKKEKNIGGDKFGYERYKDNSNILKIRKNIKEQKILGYMKLQKKKYINIKKTKLSKSISYDLNKSNLLNRNKKWTLSMVHRLLKSNLSSVKEYDISTYDNWIQCDDCKKWRKLNDKYFDRYSKESSFLCTNIPCFNCNIPEEKYYPDTIESLCQSLNMNVNI